MLALNKTKKNNKYSALQLDGHWNDAETPEMAQTCMLMKLGWRSLQQRGADAQLIMLCTLPYSMLGPVSMSDKKYVLS